jgi:hypothetical protein
MEEADIKKKGKKDEEDRAVIKKRTEDAILIKNATVGRLNTQSNSTSDQHDDLDQDSVIISDDGSYCEYDEEYDDDKPSNSNKQRKKKRKYPVLNKEEIYEKRFRIYQELAQKDRELAQTQVRAMISAAERMEAAADRNEAAAKLIVEAACKLNRLSESLKENTDSAQPQIHRNTFGPLKPFEVEETTPCSFPSLSLLSPTLSTNINSLPLPTSVVFEPSLTN